MTRQLSLAMCAGSFLFLGVFSVVGENNPLVGEWVAAATSRGGLGGTKTYTTNGTVVTTYGAVLDFRYQMEGTTLISFVETGKPMQQEITLSGSQMILKDKATGQEQKLTRMDGSSGSGIVGKWTGGHYTGGKQIMDFTTNLNCYFSVPMMTAIEPYTVKGSTLTEESERKGTTSWTWVIQNDILTLTKVGTNKVERYKKKK